MATRTARLCIGLVLAIGLTAAAAGTAGAADQNVRDGNFESPALPTGGSAHYQKGDSIGPWVVARGGTILLTKSRGQVRPPHGAQVLSLTGFAESAGGRICQNLSGLIEGATYELRLFAASLDATGQPSTFSTIDARINNIRVGFLDLASTRPAHWTRAAFGFSAGIHERLCIEGIPSATFTYPLVDAVAVTRGD